MKAMIKTNEKGTNLNSVHLRQLLVTFTLCNILSYRLSCTRLMMEEEMIRTIELNSAIIEGKCNAIPYLRPATFPITLLEKKFFCLWTK